MPFGMVLVPREPTNEMLIALKNAGQGGRERWAALLAAAPAVAPLTLETAEEARKDRAHAEAYYRQAERLLTANEQTLCAERDALRAALLLMLRGTQEDCGVISMPKNEAVRAAFTALAAAPAVSAPANANGRWTVISPQGEVFAGESPFRAASVANKHWVKTDPEAAKRFAAALESIRAENEAENARLLAEHGTLNCPTCGGSGHIGDVAFPSPATVATNQEGA